MSPSASHVGHEIDQMLGRVTRCVHRLELDVTDFERVAVVQERDITRTARPFALPIRPALGGEIDAHGRVGGEFTRTGSFGPAARSRCSQGILHQPALFESGFAVEQDRERSGCDGRRARPDQRPSCTGIDQTRVARRPHERVDPVLHKFATYQRARIRRAVAAQRARSRDAEEGTGCEQHHPEQEVHTA